MGAFNIAVIDLETTGIVPQHHNRVIEIGVVVINERGETVQEFETLVNPARDIGDTGIHQITSYEVKHAPRFEQVAGDLIRVLRPCHLIGGHNVMFDINFLRHEYSRITSKFPAVPFHCTRSSVGGSLDDCCNRMGLEFEGMPHRAICDARMTAAVIRRLIETGEFDEEIPIDVEIPWPEISPSGLRFCRSMAEAKRNSTPPFLQRIAGRVHHDVESSSSELLAYLALLDRVLEDRTIDQHEEDLLVSSAASLGLSLQQLNAAHEQYLQNLVVLALDDGVVSDAERNDLHAVTKLLGLDSTSLDHMLDVASMQLASIAKHLTKNTSLKELVGKTVCFTGTLLARIGGERISRTMAEKLATQAGLKPANNVTKKLDILVVADPDTMSGKAKKARDYGTRIVADMVFWQMIGAAVD